MKRRPSRTSGGAYLSRELSLLFDEAVFLRPRGDRNELVELGEPPLDGTGEQRVDALVDHLVGAGKAAVFREERLQLLDADLVEVLGDGRDGRVGAKLVEGGKDRAVDVVGEQVARKLLRHAIHEL